MKAIKPIKVTGTASTSGGSSFRKNPTPKTAGSLQLAKRFFLYRNIFGDMGGAPKMDMGGLPKQKLEPGLSPHPLGQSGIGGLSGLASAKRMGLL